MILVGVDFQQGSWAALQQARELARATGLPLEALHVTGYGNREAWKPRAEELMWLERAEMSAEEVKIRSGVPWVELVRYARERGALVIVAGRHGGTGFQPLYLGSTAHRLATNAPDPVLLVSGEGTKHRLGTLAAHREDLRR